jgi:hypothetical protein
LVLVVVFTAPPFFLAGASGTIIHLVDCLYDGFMDEEPSSTAEATAAEKSSSTAAPAEATAAKATTAAPAEATAAEANARCSGTVYAIVDRPAAAINATTTVVV